MTKPSVIVAGIARNIDKTLELDIAKLNSSLGRFNKIFWIIIESDSTDDTREILQRLQNCTPNFSYKCLGELNATIPERTVRISHCRNQYMQEIENNEAYADADYVLIADLDGTNNLIDQKGIDSCFSNDTWAACTANQAGPYYDVWALRHHTWSPNDCWKQQKFLQNHGWSKVHSIFSSVYARMIVIPQFATWIEVDSSFGGLGLYRKNSILSLRYTGVNEQGEEVCEHVPFHQSLKRRGGQIFINPAMINCDKVAHTRKLRLPHRFKLKLQLFLWPFFPKN